MKPDYTSMTEREFELTLIKMINKDPASYLLYIDGVYELVAEALNNQVLDAWAEQNPERAYKEDEQ